MRSGPPPDPNALRRERDSTTWRRLPAAGRQADPPPWPLPYPTRRERSLWAEEWRRPQAIVWEERGQELEVALYVRAVVVSERRKATASDRRLVLTYMDDLGISGGGLAKNHWIIEGAPAEVQATGTEGRQAKKERFTVVDGSG